MSSIVIAGDTSGSVTLQAPAVSGSTVLNLPATSGTIQASGAGYTTNGVAYATSATGLVTGSALTFDGTNFLLASGGLLDIDGTNAAVAMRIRQTTVGAGTEFSTTITENTGVTFDSSDSAGATARSFIWTAAGTEQMRLNSTGLGIGTSSPSAKLHVNGGRTLAITGNENYSLGVGREASTNAYYLGVHSTSSPNLLFSNNAGTTNMTLDYSGNLGLGVTPAASVTIKGLQAGNAMFAGVNGGSYATANAYFDGSVWKYITSNFATLYQQSSSGGTGKHVWSTAASGTAGNTITFTEAMTLDASGNLGVGGTASAVGAYRVLDLNHTTGGYLSLSAGGTRVGALYGASTVVGLEAIGASSPIQFVANSAERARITSGGDLCVGATSSTSSRLLVKGANTASSEFALRLHDSADTVLFYVRNDGYTQTGGGANSPYNLTTASAANLWVGSNGELRRSTSSLKYKTDVQDATHGLAKVMALRPVTYKGNNDGETIFGGLIAEEVHEAGLTEFVQYAEDGSPDALAYGNMVSLAFKAIQEQQALITTLTERITALEGV